MTEAPPLHRKQGRALRGEHQNWIKAQWVNGVTYDDLKSSCAKNRAIEFTTKISKGETIEFNSIVNPGGGEKTEDKRVMSSIFSVYNLSRQMDAFKRTMDEDDMAEICELLNIETDNTLILLFQRGSFSQQLTDDKVSTSEKLAATKIRTHSIFQ